MLLFLASFLLHLSSVFTAEVCYPPYGCFGDDAPFDEALVQLPWGPDDLKTQFLFYTNKDLKNPTGIIKEFDPKGASKVGFSPNKPTVFLTHGYIENRRRWWVEPCIKELLNYDDINLIFVEWQIGSAFPYHQAVGNTRMVGAQIAHLIELIRNDTGIDWERMRLIGFSLGAHVMGYVGHILKLKGMTVPRITGLDPASPYYENKHTVRRLDPGDADFVDVMHTDTSTLVVNGFGTLEESGHVDFFPNGGHDQVGCEHLDVSVVQYLACSHYRAIRYYIESINSPCPYYGYPCKSYEDFKNGHCSHCPKWGCPRMGYHVTRPEADTGMRYFSMTNKIYPFCAYHYNIILYTSKGYLTDLHGTVTIELTGDKGAEEVTLPRKYYKSGSSERNVVTLQKNIGELRKVRVKHDRIVDIWHLEAVSVRLMSTTVEYIGCFNRWLNNNQNQVDLFTGKVEDCRG